MSSRTPGTVAVTGGTGFVGRFVLRELVRRGYQVKALTRGEPRSNSENVAWISGDLADAAAMDRLVADADAVVHIAGLIKARRKRDFFRANQQGTRILLDSIKRVLPGKPVRYLHVSSIVAREPHLSSYAASKVAAEDLVRAANEYLHWTILRPPAVYGPEDEETLIFFQMAGRRFVPIPGNLSNRTALVHVEDLAVAIGDALEDRTELRSAIIEVDDGRTDGYAMSEILEFIQPGRPSGRRYIGVPRPILLVIGALATGIARAFGRIPMLTPGKVRELCHPDWTLHGTRLSAVSSWKPKIQAEEGLPATLEWYKSAGYL